MLEQEPRSQRSIIAGVGVIALSVIITAGLLAAFLNNRCQTQFRDSLSFYPNAEIVSEAYPFLATQRVELHSADSPQDIEAWYMSQQAAAMRERVESGDFSQTSAQNWLVVADSERGGSLITFTEQCP